MKKLLAVHVTLLAVALLCSVEVLADTPPPSVTPPPSLKDFSFVDQWRVVRPGQVRLDASGQYDTRTHDLTNRGVVRVGVARGLEFEGSDFGTNDGWQASAGAGLYLGHFKPSRLLFGARAVYAPAIDDRYQAVLLASYYRRNAALSANLGAARSDLRFGVPFHYWTPTSTRWAVGYKGRDQIEQHKYKSYLAFESTGDFDGRAAAGVTLLQDYGPHTRLKASYLRAISDRGAQSDKLLAGLEVGF